ncbi:hypothetical protein ACHAQA_009439 [Verticillium albo-atrum]
MSPDANGWEDAYAQARDFVSQMTLMEKVNITTGVGWQGERCVGNVGSVPRLGLRGLCMQDGPVGVRLTDYNSVFPSGQTVAATWDRALIYRRANAIGKEFKAKGVDVVLAPVSGPLGRNPAGGRNWEGFAADPYAAGVAMAESVKGIQDAHVVATAKHFVGNEQEHFRIASEWNNYGYNISESLSSNIDDKTMHEVYLWPFADAVRAGVGSVMCSYQQVNNSYGCQNSKLMNGLLKSELGFQGFVMSDWMAQHTGAASAVAGLDMTMAGDDVFYTGSSYWGTNLTLSVINGTVPAYRLDDMAMRIMAAFFKVGMTVDNQPDINFSSWTLETNGPVQFVAGVNHQVINQHVDVRQKGHAELIREIAAKGTVLLKNDGSLPLNKPRFLAVIGNDAGSNTKGPNGCADRACVDGTFAAGWGSGTANYPYLVTPDQALQQQAIKDHTRYESILTNNATTATNALFSQDEVTALVFVYAASGEGYLSADGINGDRNDLHLLNGGDDLIRNISSICNNTIVVIHSPGPVIVNTWHDSPNVTAIVWAGLPGQEAGNAIVDILYGKVNPSGKSPFTWGPSRESYGADVLYEQNNGNDAPQLDFSEGSFIDYRYFDRNAPNAGDEGAPVYEFGFGLSYTTFNYSNIRVNRRIRNRPYSPRTGTTGPAPNLAGNFSRDPADYLFPSDEFEHVPLFIYPYLNVSGPREASADASYGQSAEEFLPPHALDSSAQPVLPSSGEPGGNPQLYDVLYTVTATITNTGQFVGNEVPQLYVSLGGPNEPVRVLRGFNRLRIDPGNSVTFKADLTRRDLSNWDVVTQNWVITEFEKTVYVGSSSRNLPLSAPLN